MEDRENRIDILLDYQRTELERLTALRDDIDEKLNAARIRASIAADHVAACRALVQARSKGAILHERLENEPVVMQKSSIIDDENSGVRELNAPNEDEHAGNLSSCEVGVPNKDKDTEHLSPIGVMYTSLQKRHEAPRQSFTGPTSTGVLHLETELHHNAFDGIAPHSRVLILYWFDRNGGNWRTHVRPPRRAPGTGRIGVLATRSPNRPTAIGLSFGDVVRIERNRLYLRGLDVLDETPIITIRPYYAKDKFVDSTMGWLNDKSVVRPLHYDMAEQVKRVEFEGSVMDKLRIADINAQVVSDALGRGHGRDGMLPQGAFRVMFKLREDTTVIVTDVVSGMRREVCEAESRIDPELAKHARFKKLEDLSYPTLHTIQCHTLRITDRTHLTTRNQFNLKYTSTHFLNTLLFRVPRREWNIFGGVNILQLAECHQP